MQYREVTPVIIIFRSVYNPEAIGFIECGSPWILLVDFHRFSTKRFREIYKLSAESFAKEAVIDEQHCYVFPAYADKSGSRSIINDAIKIRVWEIDGNECITYLNNIFLIQKGVGCPYRTLPYSCELRIKC